MPLWVSCTVVATGVGASHSSESRPTRPGAVGLAATVLASALQSGIGGGLRGPAQATCSPVALSNLSSAMTCAHAVSPALMSDWVSVRGPADEADWRRFC